MPKRKATARLSGLIGSDDEDVMQHAPDQGQNIDERPSKRSRGRPRSKSAEHKPPAHITADSAAALTETSEAATRRGSRRGRPKGSRNSGGQVPAHEVADTHQHDFEHAQQDEEPRETGGGDDIGASQEAPRTTKSTKPAKGTGARGRKKGSAAKQIKTDGEFEYTPTGTRFQKPDEKIEEHPEQPVRRQRKGLTDVDKSIPEPEQTAQEVVDETIIQEELPEPRSVPVSPSKRRQSSQRALPSSPSKRKPGGAEDDSHGEPELRRRLGDLTKRYDTLENRYRNLKEIGIVEANANVEKLKKQCESMTTASNNLVASLKAELETQKALGQKSRSLQKQLRERDAEVAHLMSQSEQVTNQLAAAQSEVKALQTKLAAARSTAATLESAALKVPGSAVKGGNASRANAAANAEAAQAAQFAQLKEDLYSDLTGLIIRDVKKRETDSLYDCIQTGVNGTLHFKLVVPHVSSTNFETAEFQYIPLLDENRDREMVGILPEYLTVDITFVRQQASKFYTRVIDALTKRRTSSGN